MTMATSPPINPYIPNGTWAKSAGWPTTVVLRLALDELLDALLVLVVEGIAIGNVNRVRVTER